MGDWYYTEESDAMTDEMLIVSGTPCVDAGCDAWFIVRYREADGVVTSVWMGDSYVSDDGMDILMRIDKSSVRKKKGFTLVGNQAVGWYPLNSDRELMRKGSHVVLRGEWASTTKTCTFSLLGYSFYDAILFALEKDNS